MGLCQLACEVAEREIIVTDHRTKNGERRRVAMRKKLIEAAMVALSDEHKGMSAVIDDVIKVAGVARGTFYNYFQSMDEVKSAIGDTLNEQMVNELLPIYEPINCPCYRFAVGTRMFLIRGYLDSRWANFVRLPDVWSQKVLVAVLMSKDLREAKEQGLMQFADLRVTTDFILGGVASAIQALHGPLDDPLKYIRQACEFALKSLQCSEDKIEDSLNFSESYLNDWLAKEPQDTLPLWIQHAERSKSASLNL